MHDSYYNVFVYGADANNKRYKMLNSIAAEFNTVVKDLSGDSAEWNIALSLMQMHRHM